MDNQKYSLEFTSFQKALNPECTLVQCTQQLKEQEGYFLI